MEKVTYFQLDTVLEQSLVESCFKETLPTTCQCCWLEKKQGILLCEEDLQDVLDLLIQTVSGELGVTMTILSSVKQDELSRQALRVATIHRRGHCVALVDAITLAYLHHDQQVCSLFSHYFDHVEFSAMKTAEAFLETGLNASRAAKKYYLHRNTFQYRLQKFIDQSGLDIRDLDHARLFYFYQLIKRE